MPTESAAPIVGVDWGTTHRRAYVITSSGECVREMSDSDGAMACKGRFPTALTAALEALQTTPSLVVSSGMVGSALGWHEVPYVDATVALPDLACHAFQVPDATLGAPVLIVPGYCIRNASGVPDVMRGEETQLLGAWAMGHVSGWFVLPGTHSKWVLLQDGVVRKLRTYMTGELYDLLRKQGTLAAAAGGQTEWDDASFAAGVDAAGGHALSHVLFSARARVVSKDMSASSTAAYLSGVLIGTELKDVLGADTGDIPTFDLIGSPQLAELYQKAAARLGCRFNILDARQVFLAAVQQIHSQWSTR
jgi:2-dehydro-3-deoxygalactonokinase